MSRAARLAELRALRASGKSRTATYEVDDVEDVYEEVDEEGYKKVLRTRLDQDDFVVDDNGEGYVDDGREDWQDERQYSESESGGEAASKGKAGKRKREEDKEKQEKIKNGINKYFTSKTAQAPKAKPTVTAEDKAFLDDLLGEVDVNISARAPSRMKPVKDASRRKTRVLSPGVPDSKPAPRMFQSDPPAMADRADSPPAIHVDYDDEPILPPADDDVLMSDPLPSSPVTKAVARKGQPSLVKVEEEDDDDMEVAQAVGAAKSNLTVNLAGSRPVPKPKVKKDLAPPAPSSPQPPRSDVDNSAWVKVAEQLNVVNNPANTPAVPQTASIGKLKPSSAVEEDGSLRFFWLDYTEIHGSLCLFGKVKDKTSGNYVSAFVKVDNIQRKLFFLPREFRNIDGREVDEEVGMGDVSDEVGELMSRLRVGTFKVKRATRKYAFELPDIPKEGEYLKLFYPYDKPALGLGLTGKTFSHVFGTNTSLFEQFVLWKNIMGPCWLSIVGADFTAVTNASWCKLELAVTQPQLITTTGSSDNLDAPPLTIMSLALRTSYNPKDNKQEIVIASARFYENISLNDTTPAERLPSKTFTIMRPPGDAYPLGFKREAEKHRGMVALEASEGALLSKFMAILGMMDPDVIMGHKLDDVDFGILLSRMKERKTTGWHRIGRLRRSDWPRNFGKGGASFFVERQMAAGRLLCDLANDLGKSLMAKCQSWTLGEMCDVVLGIANARNEFDNEVDAKTLDREGLMGYLQRTENDTHFIAAIALKIQMLPLTKVLTNLAGNSWARTLSGTRAERNEYILLHEFHRNKYICPDKIPGKGKQKEDEAAVEGEAGPDAKKKEKYKGGLVFEPEKKLYDKFVLVMDFNSLYPSIIQEFNICFTTVERADIADDDDKVPEVPEQQDLGILPRLLSTLVGRRREVKKLMKDKKATPDQLATWDIKQMALKLTANSMYGCLGYIRSRFYARPIAVLITYKGREILRSTKELAETQQLRVIYGDTDSVMINTNKDNIQEALKLGSEFRAAVNKMYNLLEIDIDNVFRRLLLHAKKKYAAINMVERDGAYVEKLEVKGLDMRRREYCQLSKETSQKLLNFILSGDEPEVAVENIHEYLRQLAQQMREYKIPAQKYTIFTQLGKSPNDYPNGASMPSVQVAKKLLARGKSVKAKDVMFFIITGSNNGSAESAASNAAPLSDVLKPNSELKPDIDYYLHKQILPPVERLCAPIDGTNVTRLAECLGLDTSKYRTSTISASEPAAVFQPLESQIPDAERFKDALPLTLRCRCGTTSVFRGLLPPAQAEGEDLTLPSAQATHAGLACPDCTAPIPLLSIAAQVEAQIRQHIARFYSSWVQCDEPGCAARTRTIRVQGSGCLGPRGLGHGCMGKMRAEYGEKRLYNQLLYLQRVFDVERVREEVERGIVKGEERDRVLALVERNRERFGTLGGVVRGYLERNGRGWVAMDGLFGFAIKG
ncbi:DNA polymeras-like protein alpha catalytic subunit [Trichodelitschia bisporula]|uniref:DNA polymerase n=1 Tax=Trichodelitschia bisporula TaxID=703511 RepID=A0A6G1HQV3_9PEZI|nr:DNA polymeras-like protein alpha catalytic subunit [Trichodelitschia bisporula]